MKSPRLEKTAKSDCLVYEIKDWNLSKRERYHSALYTSKDGSGYYGTASGYSKEHSVFAGDAPEWATKVFWFGKSSSGGYQSGGRNPNWQKVCIDCKHRIPSKEHYGWGWCALNDSASVSPTGGCDRHESAPMTPNSTKPCTWLVDPHQESGYKRKNLDNWRRSRLRRLEYAYNHGLKTKLRASRIKQLKSLIGG